MEQKNKQPKVEPTQPIEQPKQKSVKPKQIGQFVSNGVKLMLYGAVIMVMGIGLLWSFSRQTPTANQENSNSYLPVVVNQQDGMTIEMVMEMVNGYCVDGQIEGDGLCNSLRAKLEAAIEARERGQFQAACNQLDALTREAGAQKNKKMTSEATNRLVEAAGFACAAIWVTPTPIVSPTAIPTDEYIPQPIPTLVGTTSSGRPVYVIPPPIIPPTYTPTPVVTPTPTPIPAVHLISDEPLFSSEVILQMGEESERTIQVIDWSTEDEMILEVGSRVVDADGTVLATPTYWQYTVSQQTVEQIEYTRPQTDKTAIIEEFQQFDERVGIVGHLYISPDNQWVTWNGGNVLLLKQIGSNYTPIEVVNIKYPNLWGGSNPWSPQSDHFAFSIKNTHSYEIWINNLSGEIITVVSLWDSNVWDISWAPNGQYLAFTMAEIPRSGINHLYIVKPDGEGFVQLTNHGLVDGDIHWSTSSDAIIYSHDGDNRPWIATIVQAEKN